MTELEFVWPKVNDFLVSDNGMMATSKLQSVQSSLAFTTKKNSISHASQPRLGFAVAVDQFLATARQRRFRCRNISYSLGVLPSLVLQHRGVAVAKLSASSYRYSYFLLPLASVPHNFNTLIKSHLSPYQICEDSSTTDPTPLHHCSPTSHHQRFHLSSSSKSPFSLSAFSLHLLSGSPSLATVGSLFPPSSSVIPDLHPLLTKSAFPLTLTPIDL